ncbi:high mobility group B protein 10-like [Pyrus ussuriensis x Pyrus communis]|uniref:High mobility group B protein 10-like n=1 Tax=Pyrus ussuriensis x Pyrus communis TaxID=2448454 RepID=A0A5N5G0C5_9ROSA|nr:high mobility group B protein 10-like [Pyrus ussuriensis x Pyrus communis]
MACCNGGSKYGGESSAATPTHQTFIKMASPIFLVKSNQVVLKLQSFHEENIQAQEKVDELWSQFRPKYKPKSPPCLRPTLKKFKRVRNKHHNGKQREAFVRILGFQSLPPATRLLLDSTCILGSAFFVSNVQKLNCTDHGYERVGSLKERFKSPDFSISDGILIDFSIHFDVGFILDVKQMLIPAEVIKCEVSFDSSMIIDKEDASNLGLHHLETCMDKNRKHERNFTLSRFGNRCCVVCCVVLDRDYCKGIPNKGDGSKFRILTVGGKSLDLHLIFVEVTSRGGLDKVTRDHNWKEVIVAFNFLTTITSVSFVLQKYYLSLLYHFEQAYYLHKVVFSIPVLEPVSKDLFNGSTIVEEGASRN